MRPNATDKRPRLLPVSSVIGALLAVLAPACAEDHPDDSIDDETSEVGRRCDDRDPCTRDQRVGKRCVHERILGCENDGGATDGSAIDSGATDGAAAIDAVTPPGPLPPTPDGGGGDAAPSGGGIASKYANDIGIGNDPDVLFYDDFETYSQPGDLAQRWDAVYQNAQIHLATTPASVRTGSKSLEFNQPLQQAELSNAVQKILASKVDELYLRFYSKFDTTFDLVGSSHNGAGISANYFTNGATPGVPANGTNKFLVMFEAGRESASDPTPGFLNAYVYHPEQRSQWGDHFYPNGEVRPNTSIPGNFGATFVARPSFVPVLGTWNCYELLVRANTPGQRDGRITMWVDGAIIADFPNLRFRDVSTLKIDRFDLNLHSGSNTRGATKKWYDAVVAAKRYIGPIKSTP